MTFMEPPQVFRSLLVQLLLLHLSTVPVAVALALSLTGKGYGVSWSNNDDATTASATARHILTRDEAQRVLDTLILRSVDKGQRLQLRNDVAPGMAVAGNDPALTDTAYGEFPFSSLDTLLDIALDYLPVVPPATTTPSSSSLSSPSPPLEQSTSLPRPLTVVDLGSGCGRLALYMALTRPSWSVHGIEIAPLLHQEACRALQQTTQLGWLGNAKPTDGLNSNPTTNNPHTNISTEPDSASITTTSATAATSRLWLHLGPAAEYTQLLQSADVIFCYSTAFASAGFSEPASALILGRDWNDLLQQCCQGRSGGGTVICITTDKALDPSAGWTILDRINVPNPEVFESTGYIQQLIRE